MGLKEDVLALAEELDGVSVKENCEACLASGTELCRGDLECAESAHKACAKRLREIVEHDAGEATTVSAYDLLPEDERKAIAWVREHGGLDEVEKRLMPEGIEWPKVDGEPVDFKTLYEPSLGVLEAVSIYSNGACEVMGHDGIIKYVNEIHVETHKVLDADGVEIKPGDTVYVLGFGEPLTVKGFTDDGRALMSFHDENSLGYKPSKLTHRAPVLAADGEPLEAGQTVWDVESGTEYEVVGIHTDEDSPVRVMRTDGSHLAKAAKPSTLTHERPVLDADGVEIRVGDTVYGFYGQRYEVTGLSECEPSIVHAKTVGDGVAADELLALSGQLNSALLEASKLTRRAPVIAADGKPLKKGETVWDTKGNGPYTITEIDGDSNVYIEGGSIPYCGAEFIRKNPDTWERINDDATLAPGVYCDRYSLFYEDDYATAMAQDLVRRARKLAESDKQ